MTGGIILLDKPQGMTSFDADKIVRRTTGIKKVGHSGTLDPFATGLLPVFTGDALKFMRYTDDYDKKYVCRAVFGAASDTGDKTGEITPVKKCGTGDICKVTEALKEIASRELQTPPKYSAKKINGRKAYELAREGVEFELKPNRIKVYSLEITKTEEEGDMLAVEFEVHCSKGTYIRTICTDAGELSGFGAYAEELRRTMAGPFDIKDSVLPDAITEDSFIDPMLTLSGMPSVELDENMARLISNGVKVQASRIKGFDAGTGALCCAKSGGRLIAVIYKDDKNIIMVDRGFA
ncbi:MAG: tRNA pseudouridine(55) synthase TruB [Saccharofermentans sp.]|nr:tRNA pseudouridine(55) synthase TruB [Saccharofermentans sp.]